MPYIDQSKDFINKVNPWVLFGIIIFAHLFITFVSNYYVFNEEVYIRSFSDQLTSQSIESFLGLQEQYQWLSYVFTPLIVGDRHYICIP